MAKHCFLSLLEYETHLRSFQNYIFQGLTPRESGFQGDLRRVNGLGTAISTNVQVILLVGQG